MDEYEEDEGPDYGIELGDTVVIETEGNVMAGTFMVVSMLGLHLRMTHEAADVAGELSDEAVEKIREGIEDLDDFELIRMGVDLGIEEPWKLSQSVLKAALGAICVRDATPEPTTALVAKKNPITRIIPLETIVTIDLFSDWRSDAILEGLDFEPNLDDEEDDEEEIEDDEEEDVEELDDSPVAEQP